MTDFSQLLTEIASSPWELLAVILAIAYLLLAMQENICCWFCALVSTAIYTRLYWDVSLFMDSLLNVYYMGMAVYGWYAWRRGGEEHQGVAIRTWSISFHIIALSVVVLLSSINGFLLSRYTQAAFPYLDSFTTWASVLTTWMVTRKILENWLYWIVIDGVSIYLYIERGLMLTAGLFTLYVIIAVFGFLEWRKHYRQSEEYEAAVFE